MGVTDVVDLGLANLDLGLRASDRNQMCGFLAKLTVILIATVIIWFLQSFDTRFDLVSDSQQSILALIAGIFTPLMRPLGLGDWRICTSLISGFMAKESVVSVLELLYGAAGGVTAAM